MGALPKFITFTGLDAWTDLGRVEDMSRQYPIEWGVLLSPKLQGVGRRYPSLTAVDAILDRGLRYSAHLCGAYARAVVDTGHCPHLDPIVSRRVDRVQINTTNPAVSPIAMHAFAQRFTLTGRAILQCRGFFPNAGEVDWLQDASGGRGETPAQWPSPEERGPFVGYAGGLGPDTIGAVLPEIQATLPPNTPYWIDMESRIRTDDRLDLNKCEAVCRAVFGDAPLPVPHERGEGK